MTASSRAHAPEPHIGVPPPAATPMPPGGGVYWGHGGSMTGYETRGGATDDGRAVSIAVTVQPDQATMDAMSVLVDKALCPRRS
ncbi:hypothetical protein [Streptomyces beihaiensis]|uniref:hypothetical protein n=1 Tax=Streptomyces beihaiensis TaxID=2984495 RepID=UPI002B1CBF98|nr:hypothetical protein [Streptomyces beihaiensis]